VTTTSTSSTPEPLLDLQWLVAGILWRRRIWVSVGLLGLLAGALLVVLVPPPPTAVARLLITHENDQGSVSESLMETDVALLETTQIAAAALERVNADERPEDFLASYAGEGLTGNVLELTVRGTSDRDAVVRAQALAEAFIADHVQRTEAAANAEAQALIDLRIQVEDELALVRRSGSARAPTHWVATSSGRWRRRTATPNLGAPGAILDGRGLNRYAFTQGARHVTIRHLTIRGFVPPADADAAPAAARPRGAPE